MDFDLSKLNLSQIKEIILNPEKKVQEGKEKPEEKRPANQFAVTDENELVEFEEGEEDESVNETAKSDNDKHKDVKQDNTEDDAITAEEAGENFVAWGKNDDKAQEKFDFDGNTDEIAAEFESWAKEQPIPQFAFSEDNMHDVGNKFLNSAEAKDNSDKKKDENKKEG